MSHYRGGGGLDPPLVLGSNGVSPCDGFGSVLYAINTYIQLAPVVLCSQNLQNTNPEKIQTGCEVGWARYAGPWSVYG